MGYFGPRGGIFDLGEFRGLDWTLFEPFRGCIQDLKLSGWGTERT